MKSSSPFIRPNKNINLNAIEGYYKELYGNNTSVNLVIPINIKFDMLGNKAAFTQFINTWVRYAKNGKLFIYDNADLNKIYENIANELPSLTGIIMAKDKGIYGYTSKNNITDDVSKYCHNEISKRLKTDFRLEESEKEFFQIHYDGDKGNRDEETYKICTDIYAFDNVTGEYIIQNKREIGYFTDKIKRMIFDKVGSNNFLQKKDDITEEDIENISGVLTTCIYELFENTYRWGWKKPPNTRSIFLRLINAQFNTLIASTIDVVVLQNYINTVKKLLNKTDAHFLELSILDSGDGMAYTISKKDFRFSDNIEEEYSNIKSCFIPRNTGGEGYDSITRGWGLYKTILDLNKKAIIKIRTGHLSLFRDFLNTPFDKENPDFTLYDISDTELDPLKASQKIKRYSWAEGTLLTIAMPLKKI